MSQEQPGGAKRVPPSRQRRANFLNAKALGQCSDRISANVHGEGVHVVRLATCSIAVGLNLNLKSATGSRNFRGSLQSCCRAANCSAEAKTFWEEHCHMDVGSLWLLSRPLMRMLRRVARGMPLRVSGSVGGSLERLKAAENTRPSNAEGGCRRSQKPEGDPRGTRGASSIGGQGAHAVATPL